MTFSADEQHDIAELMELDTGAPASPQPTAPPTYVPLQTTSDNSSAASTYEIISSDSESEANQMDDAELTPSLRDDLAQWLVEENITRESGLKLMKILRRFHPELPIDPRTITTGSTTAIEVVKKCGGDYYYIGVIKQIQKLFSSLPPSTPSIELQINVDGLPLFKSSSKQIWPILVSANQQPPFVAAVFCGTKKPDNVNEYLSDFLSEVNAAGGVIDIEGIQYQLVLSSVVADAPARAFLKQIVNHNGYHACERCQVVGERCKNRMVYTGTNNEIRTNEAFNELEYADEHQLASSPFIGVIGCVSDFVLDYMHLVCLGIVKRMIKFWRTEMLSPAKLSPSLLRALSTRHANLHGSLPSEVTRQPRSLLEVDRWKATEWRSFLLYTGITVLDGILSKERFQHFAMLMVGCSILLDDDDEFRSHYLSYSRELLTYFVELAPKLYGTHFVTYNVHSLIHLADDCEHHGKSLNNLNAFPFENTLGSMKRLVRNGNNPVCQIVKRVESSSRALGKHTLNRVTCLGRKPRDSGILLTDGRLGMIETIDNGNIYCKIVPKSLETNVFDIPAKSSTFNIIRISNSRLQNLPTEVISPSLIKKKAVVIDSPGGPDKIFLPMRHLLNTG